MAYARVAQADHDTLLNDPSDNHLNTTGAPNVAASPPLSQSFNSPDHVRDSTDSHGGVGGLLKSFTSSQSYEMVEDDDYDHTNSRLASPTTKFPEHASPDDYRASETDLPPIRTASISRHLPLNHPTPDLHTLQGALVRNVERLEESAERLSSSMTSSLEEELDKMRKEQRRIERQSSAPVPSETAIRPSVQRQFSVGSFPSSIIGVNQAARTGGYSPSGYITSPTGSIRSGPYSGLERHTSRSSRRSHQLPEPPMEGRPLDFHSGSRSSAAYAVTDQDVVRSPGLSTGSIPEERPVTATSNDTYRQAESAFDDFDGVHYNNGVLNRMDSMSRRISLKHPPLARDAKAYKEAQPGEKMIYYPAPVPVMLNLPQRLSKANFGERERRRLQALSGIPDEMRKSAAWLAEQDPGKLPEASNKRGTLQLPPQLRASAFFDKPGVTQDLQLKDGSAVQTLDSILDAAAHAPVSAFTDHPIIGQLGKEVYGPNTSPRKSTQISNLKAKRRSSLSNLLSRTKSRELKDDDEYASGDELGRAADDSISPDADEIPDGENASEDEENTAAEGFDAAPTTLLAELQMRKEHQKLRNRTAADAFPNGMHSTLLELDAVTQLQQKARRTKHVTLAWEDHEEADKQNFDDEDVPLGVLYPEKDRTRHLNMNQPLGLLEKREMEDNEPLSHRRARLRGEPYQPPRSDVHSHVEEEPAPMIADVPGLDVSLDEKEEETLAQRVQRMKQEKEKGTAGEFSEEVASQLGLNIDESKTPDPEETLGQRRQRLKEEAMKKQANGMHNLASVLQAHPTGLQSRQALSEARGLHLGNPKGPGPGRLLSFNHDPGFQSAAMQFNPQRAYTQPNVMHPMQAYGNNYPGTALPGTAGFNAAIPGLYGAPIPAHMQYPMGIQYGYGSQPFLQDPMMGPPLDPKQRAQIDRWRQGIVQ